MAILEVSDLVKNFGGLLAVNKLSFVLNEGEMLALIGPNGAGKTTVFNTITGFYRPSSGEILFKNQAIHGLKPHKICRLGMARTFQIVQPFPELTIFENILIGAFSKTGKMSKAMARAEEVLETTGLYHLRDIKGSAVTLADRKRLELAKSMATGADVVLLDEVMAGLTPKETKDFINLIQSINSSGVTFLIIEHNMKAVVALAQRIIVIDYGTKIAEGTPDAVLQNQKVIDAYLGKGSDIA